MNPPQRKFPLDSETEGNLDAKNTFASFVVGNHNNFAYTAANVVAEAPGKSYNPLFLYGRAGLGKTHLLHAIGQHWMTNREDFSFTYVSSTKFASEFAESIQTKRLDKFRLKYRHTGALLIDDIQLLAGKKRLQEEFFHTFNALLEAHKQIVVTCDRPVSAIEGLDHRLASCFESGLVADLQPPDVEMRLAILKMKAQSMGVTLPDDIINFLAQRIRTNIRRLLGALIRVASYASLTGKQLNVEIVSGLLREILHEEGCCSMTEATEINLESVQIVTLPSGPFKWFPSALPKPPALSQPRWSY